jgi:type IV secretion system protein VirB4
VPTAKWFRQAKPSRSIIPLSRFVSDSIFALKTGGYGCLFSLAGIDDEGLTDLAIRDIIARVHRALENLPDGARLYQYLRVRKGFEIPTKGKYDNPTVAAVIADRRSFLEENAHLRRIELFWCLTIEPSASHSFGRKKLTPEQYSRQCARFIAQVQKTAEILTSLLSELLGLTLLSKQQTAAFFSYLINLEDWSMDRRLISDEDVDRQLVHSSVEWHPDHLRIGKQYVQMFSLLNNPAGSRPHLFAALQTLDLSLILCASWAPAPRATVEKRVAQIEGFIGIFKNKFLALAANIKDPENLEKTIGSRAAEKGADKLAEILHSVDNLGHQFGFYSLFLLIHSRDQSELADAIPSVHRALVETQAPYIEETIGNLAAYYAIFPGNSVGDAASNFNVRRFWLRDDHHADLALIFAPYIGRIYSDDLENEYLSVYETRTGSPFFLDPYVDGMRTTLILGAPRTGKSVHGNQIIAHEQKYGGFTYTFDIGGSFESTIRLFGGSVQKIGADGPTINPFSLDPTEDNLQFLFGFIRLLLVKGGAPLSPEDEAVIDKSVRRMYVVSHAVRRLKYMVLPPHLQRFLAKWTEGGVYGRVFDNLEDSLRLARIQCFDFEGLEEESQRDLIEPMLFWILRQTNRVIYDRAHLGVPKHLLFDELWKHLRTRQLLEMVLSALKTGGKHLAGATLLTQSADDLGDNADLIVNACSTFLFLPDPTFNRERYQTLFHLNDQEILNLASLAPREALLKRAGFSKIIRLNLDPKSYWLFTTRPKDRLRRAQAIAEVGYERAFELLRTQPI